MEVDEGEGVNVGDDVAVGLAVGGIKVKVGVSVSVGGTGVWETMPIAERKAAEGAQAANRIAIMNNK